MCYSADVTGSSFSVHRGLAAKLFTVLTLLGAIAVTVTGALGYFRVPRLLEAFFDQLTTARQARASQIETYFRTIQAELRLLASSKMIVEATREFRGAVEELEQTGVRPELGWPRVLVKRALAYANAFPEEIRQGPCRRDRNRIGYWLTKTHFTDSFRLAGDWLVIFRLSTSRGGRMGLGSAWTMPRC